MLKKNSPYYLKAAAAFLSRFNMATSTAAKISGTIPVHTSRSRRENDCGVYDVPYLRIAAPRGALA